MDKNNYNIASGRPGNGGEGKKGIGQSEPEKGRNGNIPKSVNAIYEYSK